MRNVIEKLRAILLPREKYTLILMTFCVFLAALLELCGIGLIMPVIALFITPELFEQNKLLMLVKHLTGDLPFHRFLLILCTFVMFFFCLKNIFLYIVSYLQIRFAYRLTARIGASLLQKYIGADYRFSLTTTTAELSAKVQQSRNISDFINSFMVLFSEFIVILLILVMIFVLAPVTALVLTLISAVFSWAVYRMMKRLVRDLSMKSLTANARLNGFILFAIEAIREIKLGGREKYFIARSVPIEEEALEPDRLLFTYSQIPRYVVESGMVLLGMGTIVGLLLLDVAPASIALKVSFIGIAMLRLMPSISRIHYYLVRVRAYLSLFHVVAEDLRNVVIEREPENAAPLKFEQEIRIENAEFAYAEKKVFSNLTISIPKNTTLALVGHTGCGKTTIIDVIAGLLPLSKGRVLVDGHDIREHIFSWRGMIGYVPQTITLMESSIAENVALGVEKEKIDRKRVTECLRIAQAEKFISELEHGIDTMIAERGKNFSGGQRQRIGIARALYPNPSVLLFDEATSALDTETEAAFVSALNSLNGKITMIIAAHRLSTIENCNQIYRFQEK